jgi:hypothetical protein
MAYTIQMADAGYFPIANTDAGVTPANAASAIPTPPASLGCVVTATDPTFGTGEFICLCGVASTVIGSLVIWDGVTYLTTLAPVTANLGRPVAFAMSANTATTTFGWYQIGGTAVAAKTTANKFLATVALGIISTGKVGSVSSGKQILNARTANTATVVSATTTVRVTIDRPGAQGRVT